MELLNINNNGIESKILEIISLTHEVFSVQSTSLSTLGENRSHKNQKRRLLTVLKF